MGGLALILATVCFKGSYQHAELHSIAAVLIFFKGLRGGGLFFRLMTGCQTLWSLERGGLYSSPNV